MPKTIDYARQLAAGMLDEELIAIAGKMKDGDTLTLLQSAVFEELAHRQLPSLTKRFSAAQQPARRPWP